MAIICTTLLADALWWLYADRLARRLHRPLGIRLALGAFMVTQYASMAMLLTGMGLLPLAAVAAIFIWHLVLLPITVVLVGFQVIASTIARWTAMIFSPKRPSEEPAPPVSETEPSVAPAFSRRQFLTATAVLLPPLTNVGATYYAVRHLDQFRINRMELAIPSLPRALDGLTIAQVSDTHIGSFAVGHTLKAIADATNALNADLVLMTGDLINRNLSDLPAACDMVRMIDPHQGLYLIEGNHDLFEGRAAFDKMVRAARLKLLVDETATLIVRDTPIQLLGLGWGANRSATDFHIRESATRLLSQRDKEAFPILLAHHPHAFDTAIAHDIPLTLSGHTHGGQLHLSKNIGFGPLMYRYWSGLYRSQNSSLVVSNGTGNWFPLRVNAPAEIVHITLRSV